MNNSNRLQPWSFFLVLGAVIPSVGFSVIWMGSPPASEQPTLALVSPIAGEGERSDADRKSIAADIDRIKQIMDTEAMSGIFKAIPLYKQRASIARALTNKPLTDSERQFVIITMLDALTRLTETRDLVHREELYELIPLFKNDIDPLVRRQAAMAETVKLLVDYVRDEEMPDTFVRSSLLSTLHNYPADIEVMRFLRSMCIQLITESRVPLATEIFIECKKVYENAEAAECREFARQIPDAIRLAEVRYDVALSEMYMSNPDFDRYVRTVLLLSSSGEMGEDLLAKMISAAVRCERHSRFSEAKEIFFTLDKRLDSDLKEILDPSVIEKAKAEVSSGLCRMDSLGKEFQLHGVTRTGEELSSSSTDQRTVVVFWSAATLGQTPGYLPALDQVLESVQSKNVRVVGYCVDSNDENWIKATAGLCPEWNVNIEQGNESFEKFMHSIGVPESLYIIVLDKTRKISLINVDPNEIDRVLARR